MDSERESRTVGDTDSGERYEIPADEQPSEAVVEAVMNASGKRLDALEPLFDAVDPDALNALATGSDVTVAFGYDGFHVTVRNGNEVVVR